jgi:hypothetical protein
MSVAGITQHHATETSGVEYIDLIRVHEGPSSNLASADRIKIALS